MKFFPTFWLVCTAVFSSQCWSAEPIAVIEFEFRLRSPVTPVEVNGVSLPLMLDLGGDSALSLTREEAELVNPLFEDETDKYMFATGEKHESRQLLLEQVQLGPLQFRDVIGREFQRPSFSPDNLPGHIGFGILGKYQILVDYPGRKISLFDADESSITSEQCEGGSVSELDVLDHTLRSHVSFGGDRTFLMAWDTGASHNFISPKLFAESQTPDFIIGDFSFGSMPIRHMEFRGAPFDGIIGHDFFKKNLVCFDFGRKIVAIRKL